MIHDNNAANTTLIGKGSPAGMPSGVATPAPSTLHVLIVDDDPVISQILSRALLDQGYHVTSVEDGERAWEQLGASDFDGMITDYTMPRLSGLELIRRVRMQSSRLPIILISGMLPVHDAELERLLVPGVAIEKPFNLREFLVVVQDTFGRPRYSDPRRSDRVACTASNPPWSCTRLSGKASHGPKIVRAFVAEHPIPLGAEPGYRAPCLPIIFA